jgi:hypothetical protein
MGTKQSDFFAFSTLDLASGLLLRAWVLFRGFFIGFGALPRLGYPQPRSGSICRNGAFFLATLSFLAT